MLSKSFATGLLFVAMSTVSFGSVIVNDNGGLGFTVTYSPDIRCVMPVEGRIIELGHYSDTRGYVHRPTTPYSEKSCTTTFLSESTVISSASSWVSDASNVMLNFYPTDEIGEYIGLRWSDGSNWYYGWANIASATSSSYVVSAWAYESTPGVAIAAGAVPEPATIVLLTAGCLAMLKRKKVGR